MKPVLFVTNHAPPFRVGAFAALHEREDVVFALIGGDVRHGGGAGEDAGPAVPGHPAARSSDVARLGVRRLPRGRRRALRPRRAARRLRSARAGRACRSCCGRRSGRTRARPRTPLSYLPLRHLYRHADAIVTYGPHVSAYVRSKGAHADRLRGPAERRQRVLDGTRRPNSARRVPGRVCRADWRGKRASGAHSGLAFFGLVSTQRRAGSGRRRSDPSPGRRHRRGPARRAALAGRSAQLLCGQRRCRRTVGPHARLPRAVGAGRQRSLQPGSPRDRHRRRRRRRRRTRAPRAHRARRPRRGRRRARRRAAPAARRPGPAGAAGRRRARGGRRLHARRVGGRNVKRACGRGERAVASVEGHGSSADAQRADPAARCARPGERGRPRARSCASARTVASPATTRRSSSATRASTSPPTSTSTPTAATCSRRPRSTGRGGSGGGGGAGGSSAPGGVVGGHRRRSPLTAERPGGDRQALDTARLPERQASRSATRPLIPGATGLAADRRAPQPPDAAARRPHPARPLRLRRDVRVRPPTCPHSPAALARASARGRGSSSGCRSRSHAGADVGRRARDRRRVVRRRAAGCALERTTWTEVALMLGGAALVAGAAAHAGDRAAVATAG